MTLGLIDRRRDEGLHQLERIIERDRIGAHAQDVRTVMLTRQRNLLDRGTERGTHVLETVRRHRHADAGLADEHPEIRRAHRDVARDLNRIVAVIAARAIIRTLVNELVSTLERIDDRALELHSAVVGTDNDFHVFSLVFGNQNIFSTA